MNIYQEIFTKLSGSGVKYMIVGGVAVNLYGFSRFTGDIDIILALDNENLGKLEKLMHQMGYKERLPVSVKDLGDARKLKDFIVEKGMKAFTFISEEKPQLDIDIITKESMDFAQFEMRKTLIEVWGIELPVIDINDLIGMKRNAGRSKDKIDIEALLKLKELS